MSGSGTNLGITEPVASGILFHTTRSWVPGDVDAIIRGFRPHSHLGEIVRRCLPHLPVEAAAELIDAITKTVVVESRLSLVAIRGNRDNPWNRFTDHEWFDLTRRMVSRGVRMNGQYFEDYGQVSCKVVTTAGVGFLVDALQNLVEPEIMKYHGLGTGTNAEDVADTALQTELTTQYNPNSTRATGTLTEGSGANVFRSVATNTLDGSATITEHGILSQAATGGGVLLDRSVFTGLPLISGDSLQSTYDLTFTAGG